MSGGSFNYLHIAYGLDEMVRKRTDLNEMWHAIKVLDEAEFPGAAKAADETMVLIKTLSDAEMAVAHASMQLRDVWHAVEWWHSSDGGPEDVVRELAEFVKYSDTDEPQRPHDRRMEHTETESWVWQVVNDDLVKVHPEHLFAHHLTEENCREYIFVLVEETETTIIERRIS